MFSNPEVIRLIEESFVPYAGDQWYLHRQKDADGEYFWKVVDQGHRKNRPRDETRQGVYIATADGRLLGSDGFRPSAKIVLDWMRASLARKGAAAEPAIRPVANTADADFARVPPEGGLVLNVYTRIAQDPAPGQRWSPNHATGRDHMWLTRAEWRALRPREWKNGHAYPVPPVVAQRLVRFHLTDNVRGEPPMWRRDEVRQADLKLVVEDAASGRLRLEGVARLQTHSADRGYDARLQGMLQIDRREDRVKQLDVLAWGEAWGQGRFTGGAPAGKFPLLVAFSLAGNAPIDRVPPQASRELRAYWEADR